MQESAEFPSLDALLASEGWLRAVARPLVRDETQVDEVLQEAWLAAIERPPATGEHPRAWLATVVRNLARRIGRRESRLARREAVAASPESLPPTGELVERVQLRRSIADAVLTLEEPYRTTVMLRYFEDLSSAEIARRAGIPEGTVRSRLKRGLDQLRERLDGTFGNRRAWALSLIPIAAQGFVAESAAAATGTVAGAALPATTFGGILMAHGLKIGLAAALLAVTALSVFSLQGLGDDGATPLGGPDAAAPADRNPTPDGRPLGEIAVPRAGSAAEAASAAKRRANGGWPAGVAVRSGWRLVDAASGDPVTAATVVATPERGDDALRRPTRWAGFGGLPGDGIDRGMGQGYDCVAIPVDAQGRFAVPELLDGWHLVAFVAGRGCSRWIELGPENPPRDLLLHAGNTVAGTVRDAGSNAPAPGVTVGLHIPGRLNKWEPVQTAPASASGEYRFSGIPAGIVVVPHVVMTPDVEAPPMPGHRIAFPQQALDDGFGAQFGDVAGHVIRDLTARSHRGADVVYVLRFPQGEEVPAHATVFREVRSRRTRKDGKPFTRVYSHVLRDRSIASTPPSLTIGGHAGSNTVRFEAGEWQGVDGPRTLAAISAPLRVEVTMRRRPQILVQVVDESGRPLTQEGLRVTLHDVRITPDGHSGDMHGWSPIGADGRADVSKVMPTIPRIPSDFDERWIGARVEKLDPFDKSQVGFFEEVHLLRSFGALRESIAAAGSGPIVLPVPVRRSIPLILSVRSQRTSQPIAGVRVVARNTKGTIRGALEGVTNERGEVQFEYSGEPWGHRNPGSFEVVSDDWVGRLHLSRAVRVCTALRRPGQPPVRARFSAKPARSLQLRVVSADGRPLVHRWLTIAGKIAPNAEPDVLQRRTDEDGRCDVPFVPGTRAVKVEIGIGDHIGRSGFCTMYGTLERSQSTLELMARAERRVPLSVEGPAQMPALFEGQPNPDPRDPNLIEEGGARGAVRWRFEGEQPGAQFDPPSARWLDDGLLARVPTASGTLRAESYDGMWIGAAALPAGATGPVALVMRARFELVPCRLELRHATGAPISNELVSIEFTVKGASVPVRLRAETGEDGRIGLRIPREGLASLAVWAGGATGRIEAPVVPGGALLQIVLK